MSHLTALPWTTSTARDWIVTARRRTSTHTSSARHRAVGTAGRALLAAALAVGAVAVGDDPTVEIDTVPAAADAPTHTVRRGETLSGIALRNGTTVRALMDANGITNANRILVGQVLRLQAASAPAAAGPTTHRVARGETLSGIAARHRVRVSDLARHNGITNPNRIVAGTRLEIPGSATAPAPAAAAAPAATPAPAAPVPAAPVSAHQFHTVRRGESLSAIATRYGTSVAALVEANDIRNPNHVRAGQSLAIPGPGPTAATACPVPGSTFVDEFGYVKPSGRAHQGIDLFAPRHTPVLAPVSGVAQHVRGPRAGLQVTFLGDDGATYYLTHLESFGQGGRVAVGTPIGTVGNSGNARYTSPHVHFERHEDGSATNPYGWLRATC